ncbi:MAG TPA: GNAT family N-acetyltransferase [Allosphingosinicella sp.]|jgi:GNAT superfamily N-acetyltransferase
MLLRAGCAADIPRLIEIRAAVRENRLSDPASIACADYEACIARGHLWVAEEGGSVLGFAALDAAAASVWALFVDPVAEGRGIGRRLLDRLVAEARALGLPALTLTTEAGSRAERLYRAAGWTIVDCGADGTVTMQITLEAAARAPPGSLPPPRAL